MMLGSTNILPETDDLTLDRQVLWRAQGRDNPAQVRRIFHSSAELRMRLQPSKSPSAVFGIKIPDQGFDCSAIQLPIASSRALGDIRT